MHEIERKYLLSKPISEVIQNCEAIHVIEQRYLRGSTGVWSIRIRKRVTEGKAVFFQTMKRRVSDMKCVEMETEISEDFYNAMAAQSGPPLRKTRHVVRVGNHLWEVDLFHDLDFCMAEIELRDEEEVFQYPEWIGREVTSKKRYANKNLVKLLKGKLTTQGSVVS